MTNLSTRSVFAFLLVGCVALAIYKLGATEEKGGPLIVQHGAPVHLFGDTRFYENSDETRDNPSKKQRVDVSGDNPSRNDKEKNGKADILSSSWQASPSLSSYDKESKETDDEADDDDEASIADIWEPIDESDDTWKTYEDDYLKMEWRENEEAFHKWRNDLELYGVDSQKNFLITHESVEEKRVLPFYLSTQHTYAVSEFFMKLIPKASPYNGKSVGRCAVVGNSGILRHSGCGKQIDAADYVFRCNIPPLVEYEEDVGVKTNLTTMNPSMLETGDYGTISISRQPDDAYNIVLEPYNGVILLPCFSHFFYLRLCIKAIRQYYQKTANMTFLHPEHFSTIWDYWRDRDMDHLPSTGFYIVNVAATLCDQVDLYGFWPFTKTGFSGKTEHVMYHYYEEGTWRPAHDMIGEFGQLFQLHKSGLLRMHLGNCTRS